MERLVVDRSEEKRNGPERNPGFFQLAAYPKEDWDLLRAVNKVLSKDSSRVYGLQRALLDYPELGNEETKEVILEKMEEELLSIYSDDLRLENGINSIKDAFEGIRGIYLGKIETEKVVIERVNQLYPAELEAFEDLLGDFIVYKKVLPKDVIQAIYRNRLEKIGNVNLNNLFSYGDVGLEKECLGVNERIFEALEELALFSDISEGQKAELFQSVARGLFGREKKFFVDPEKALRFVRVTFQSPETKRYAKPLFMNYWWEWENAIEKMQSEIDFEDQSKENIRKIAELAEIYGAVYGELIKRGIEPNNDGAVYMLNFINQAGGVDDFYLNLKVKQAVFLIQADACLYYEEGEDWQKEGRAQLIYSAAQTLGTDLQLSGEELQQFLTDIKGFFGQKLTAEIEPLVKGQVAAPGVEGHFDDDFDLVLLEEERGNEGDRLKFSEFIKLNYYDVIEEGDFLDLMFMQNLFIKKRISQELGVALHNLELRAQNQFLNFIKNASQERVRQVAEFVKNPAEEEQRLNRLRVFLSLEEGHFSGDQLLDLPSRIDADQAQQVFDQYGRLVQDAFSEQSTLQEVLKNPEDLAKIDQEKITQNLLFRGQKILQRLIESSEPEREAESVLSSLLAQKWQIQLAGAVFREGIEAGMSLDDLEGGRIEVLTVQDLIQKPELVAKMRDIYSNNFSKKPDLQGAVLQGFDQKMTEGGVNSEFALAFVGEELVAFSRSDHVDEKTRYFASLNSSYGGAKFGEALRRKREAQVGENFDIRAHSEPESAMSTLYIGPEGGFIADGVEFNYHNTEANLFSITRQKTPPSYYAWSKPREELVKEAKELADSEISSISLEKGKPLVLSLQGLENTLVALKTLLNEQGGQLTNYWFQGGRYFLAIENPKSS